MNIPPHRLVKGAVRLAQIEPEAFERYESTLATPQVPRKELAARRDSWIQVITLEGDVYRRLYNHMLRSGELYLEAGDYAARMEVSRHPDTPMPFVIKFLFQGEEIAA